MAEEIIRVEHLKKYFDVRSNSLLKKEKKIVKAVDDINFTINKGQILGIVGESGCGKSTLGRCILRLMPISGGKIYFKGTDISTLNDKQLKPYREKMQMVFQNPYSSFKSTSK